MIHILVAFVAGVLLGVFIMAALSLAGEKGEWE